MRNRTCVHVHGTLGALYMQMLDRVCNIMHVAIQWNPSTGIYSVASIRSLQLYNVSQAQPTLLFHDKDVKFRVRGQV